MAFDFTPGNFNPNQPIPNGPFFWPLSFTLQAGNGNLIVGTGLEVDAFGRLNATGGGGGSGTVTSVGVSSTNLVVSGSPITVAGVIDIEAPIASLLIAGIVKVGSNINVDVDGVISVPVGNTITPGVLQLNNTTASTSTSEALTAAQGKFLQDQINGLALVANTYLGGTLNAQTGLITEVTQAGTDRGFVVGQALPLPNATNAGVFAFVTVPSNSYTPPGSVTSYTVYEGDVFVMSNTSWIYLPSGFEAVPATTTQAGIVRLATVPEVNAGVNNTIAVTPFGLADELSTYVNSTDFTAKGVLIAGTGVSAFAALPVGTSGQVLSADPGSLTGLRWINNAPDGVAAVTGTSPITIDNTDPANPIVGIDTASFVLDADYTAKGVILSASGASTPVALPVGATGQILAVDLTTATGLRWITNAADGVQGVTGNSPITVDNTDPTNPIVGINTASFVLDADLTAKGDLLTASGASAPVALPVGTTGQILAADPTTTTGLRWINNAPDGVVSVTGTSPITVDNTNPATPVVGIDTATFVLDANYTTKGDILVASAAATPAALPIGTTGQVLVVDTTTATGLKWAAAPITGITSDTFLMGQGAPAVGVGVDGEFYVSTPDYTLYNKIGGVWVNTYTPTNTHGLQSIINSLAFDATTVLSLDSLIDFYGNPFAVDAAVTAIFTSATSVAVTVDADHGAVEVALTGLTAPQITTLTAAFFPGANLAGETATTHWNSAVVTASSSGVGLFNIVSNVFSQTDIQTLLSVPNTVSPTNANRFAITNYATLFTLGVETSTNQANRMLVKSTDNKTWVPGPDVTSFLTAGTGISVSYNATTKSWTVDSTGVVAPLSITEGATLPANTVGNDGDLFLLTTPNPQALYQKISGVWAANNVLTNLATNASYNQNETLTLGQLADVIYDDNYAPNAALQAAIQASSPTTTLNFSSFEVSIVLASVTGGNRAVILNNTGKGFGLYFNGTATTGSGDWFVDVFNIIDGGTTITLNCTLQGDSFNNFIGLTGITQTANSATVVGAGPFAGGAFTNVLTAGDLLIRSSDNEGWTVGPNFPTFLQAGSGVSVSYNATTSQWTVAATNAGTVTGVTGTAPITVDNTNPATPIVGVNAASTTAAGVVQLNDTVTSTSTTEALTANQGKLLQDQVSLKVASVTATAPITVGGTATNPVISANPASITTSGVVTLTNDLTSTSEVLAITALAGKSLQDQINALVVSGVLELAGTINASTGLVASVTASGTSAGFVVGSVLPAAAAGNANNYVIVTTPGTFTPPGGTATSFINGDWILSDGTVWQKLAVGPEVSPGGANTTIQYNDNGDFAGDTRLTWDNATGTLTTVSIEAVSVSGNGTSALVVTGGTAASGPALDVQISGGSATLAGARGGALTIAPGNGPGGYGLFELGQISSATVASSYTVTNNNDLATKAYVDSASNAAGANTEVQYNNGGAFAGSSAFTFNSANGVVSVSGITANTSSFTLGSSVPSSSLTLTSGGGSGTNAAGNIVIVAADGVSNNLSRGGSVTIRSGTGRNNSGAPGAGDVNIISAGGGFGTASGNAGNISITAGSAGTFNSSNGGNISIQAGNASSNGGSPGSVTIAPGSGGGVSISQISSAVATSGYLPTNAADLTTKSYVDSVVGGTVAGANTQIQFNNNGAFGADADLTFDSTTNTLSTTNFVSTAAATVTPTSTSQLGAAVTTTGQIVGVSSWDAGTY